MFNNIVILRSQQGFKSDYHEVYTEEGNKIALSSNDDKRLQTFDRVTTYPHGTNAFNVCKCEMMTVKGLFFEKLQWNSVTTTIKEQKIINVNINDQLWWLR